MAKPRSNRADYLVCVAVRILICIVQALTWRAALALARGLGWLAYRVDRRHRLVAEENLHFAFPTKSAGEIDGLVRASYRHLLTMVVEMIRMPRLLHKGTADRQLQYADPEAYRRVLGLVNSGRPLMFLTGHFGNWEMMSYACGAAGFHASLVARKMDNPYLDGFLKDFRRKTGQQVLDKNDDYDKILATLANRGTLGMVGDQDAGPRGLFVPFFGRPASTFKSIALLSLQFEAPIVVMAAARVGTPMRYRLYVEDIIDPNDLASVKDPVRTITQRYSDALERLVRRHPEQYFWVHRRWKHQPKAMKKAA